jgi:hypothetical protein
MLLDAENIEVFDCLFIVITKLILVPMLITRIKLNIKNRIFLYSPGNDLPLDKGNPDTFFIFLPLHYTFLH